MLAVNSKDKITPYKGKHWSQMTKDEQSYLKDNLKMRTRREIKFSEHADSALKSRGIKRYEVIKTLKVGRIEDYRIIYNKDGSISDRRVTIRNNFLSNKYSVIYVSYSLEKQMIITAYGEEKIYNFSNSEIAEKYDPELCIDIV